MKQYTAVVLGGGARGRIYADYSLSHPEALQIVGLAEPRAERRLQFQERYGLTEKQCYSDWQELLAQGRLADIAIICTLDDQHTAPCLQALALGYHVLLEKPMSNSEAECRQIAAAAQKFKRALVICHVLRYTPFYRSIKKLIDEGEIGAVASLSQIENVGYWHQAHSFVRGNWRSSAETSPMILQKSCHDMDILIWLSGQRVLRVASFGSLRAFRPENAPVGATPRCTDPCPHAETCVYAAQKIYLNGRQGWPNDMLSSDLSHEGMMKALQEGPYGRCVYYCDNDVVDRQVVSMELDAGAVASFTMTAFTTDMARQLKITGTKGQITADMNTNEVYLHRFSDAEAQKIPVEQVQVSNNYGHGGGDYFLVKEFLEHLEKGSDEQLSTAQASLQSHLVCFAAERSRLSHSVEEIQIF